MLRWRAVESIKAGSEVPGRDAQEPLEALPDPDRPARPRPGLFGINNRGEIVGFYADAAGKIRAFLLANGAFTPIDVPGAISTAAGDINEKGQVVGFFVGRRLPVRPPRPR